jgi:hypothetical protein
MTCGIETGVVAADAALAAGKTSIEDLQTAEVCRRRRAGGVGRREVA